MSLFALGLVLVAAVIHATWNLLAKRAGGGAAFVWIYAAVSAVLYAPVALPLFLRGWAHWQPIHWIFFTGSGVIHMAYFLMLQRGYRTGDLSVVYPLARGTGPMLSSLAAIAFFGERPSVAAMVGAAMISVSIFLFAKPSRGLAASGLTFGLLTGILIAIYTLWDKHAVSALAIPPMVMEWTTSSIRTLLLAPLAFASRAEVKHEWKVKRKMALWIGALNPLSYLLVLWAMATTPVTYVAPLREVSILFGALMGGVMLGEGDQRKRMGAAALMVAGMIALALG